MTRFEKTFTAKELAAILVDGPLSRVDIGEKWSLEDVKLLFEGEVVKAVIEI